MVLSEVALSFLVGLCPTVGMIGASMLLSNYEVGPKIEACFQNFAAGLIIAAVAGELFPIMANNSETNSVTGITIGFVVGLIVIFGLEKLVGYLENMSFAPAPSSPSKFERLASSEHGTTVSRIHDIEMTEDVPRKRTFTYPTGTSPEDMLEDGDTSFESADDWEEEPVHRASIAIAAPAHRDHIKEHLLELVSTVRSMEDKSNELLERASELSVRQEEDIAEKIDEQVHTLQYKLDHVRRLLQGSECEVLFNYGDSNLSPGSNTSKWVTEERKLYMKKKLSKLKSTVEHLVEHINEPIIDKHVLREMHEHMGMMDRQIARFHDIVESNASKWRRNDALPQTQIGDKLPINLILPVTIDCFVDGFLIGVSVAISRKAGFILATANFFEMSFLGMAYASRLVKCTGASVIMRNLALYAPPVVMFFSAGLGAMLAATVRHIPVCFIAFVAFGVVALLFLVCNELLIEAKNAQGEDEKWWISICIFLGIYMVLIVNQILPEQ